MGEVCPHLVSFREEVCPHFERCTLWGRCVLI